MTTLPRDQSLPLFNPHVAAFSCETEANKVPSIDAQADAWFQEANALNSPEIYIEDRDYKKIVQLTKMAAERRHWKAMLNLASLYIEGRGLPHGTEDAVQLVEAAMQLAIPAAYDRMGTFHANGTGVMANATRAYAFWQQAAQMGNPQAMAHLAGEMDAGKGNDVPGHWANIPVAIKMLECSLAQGYGPAAYDLFYLYLTPKEADGSDIGDSTAESKARAMQVLHLGVKLGCAKCARDLYIEFDHPFNLSNVFVPHIDRARGKRYDLLNDALDFDPSMRFPNLDSILPLPPSPLPPWNGDRDTLLKAAMGVSSKPVPPRPSSQHSARHFLDPRFALHLTEETTQALDAPFTGYWRPTAPEQWHLARHARHKTPPGLYRKGEAFDRIAEPDRHAGPDSPAIIWQYCLTTPHNPYTVEPRSAPGMTRVVPRPDPAISCRADAPCPATGIWQPWIDYLHPLAASVNQPWRQSWLRTGVAFPDPRRDWLMDLPASVLSWHLMEANDRA